MSVVENKHMQFILPEGWSRPNGYSQGVVARGQYVFVAGQVGWNPLTAVVESDDFVEQVRSTLLNVVTVLQQAGVQPSQIVRLTWFITDRAAYRAARREVGKVYAEIIGRHYPAMSIVVVDDLLEEGAKVEIEATAVIPD